MGTIKYPYYISTVCEKTFYNKLIQNIPDDTGIPYHKDLPDGVEITVRSNENRSVTFIFNNTAKQQEFIFEGKPIKLTPFEMMIENV